MRGLTLHQPWASLVALGAKAVETRSWGTGYRGPVAIHAGMRWPAVMHLPRLWSRGATREEQERLNAETWLCIPTITDPAFQGPWPTGKRMPRRAQTPTLFFPVNGPHGRGAYDPDAGTTSLEQGRIAYMPLGAVVAVADLVDVVPIETLGWTELWQGWAWQGPGGSCERHPHSSGDPAGGRHPVAHVDQRHFGDFRPGRWAWLLADPRPLAEPIECRGRQGLWEVPPDVEARILVAQLEDSLAAAGSARPEGHR